MGKHKQHSTGPLDNLSVNNLVTGHKVLLRDAEKLNIRWLNKLVHEARELIEDDKANEVNTISFLHQAQEVKKFSEAMQQFKHHCRHLESTSPFATDYHTLIHSHHQMPVLFEKMREHVQSHEFKEIKKLSRNSLMPKEAIELLYQTLYEVDLQQDSEGRAYVNEMVTFSKFYCQEMKKDYAKGAEKRFSDGMLELLTQYRLSRENLSASVLGILNTNLTYTGLGSLGGIIFDMKNRRENQSKPEMEPNHGQLALARLMNRHHGLFSHRCKKHEKQTEHAWEELKTASTTKQQAAVLHELADDIRQQHKSRGKFGSMFKHSKFADEVEKEARQFDFAATKASA